MTGPGAGGSVVRVRIADPDGLHARPCARIAEVVVASHCDVEIVHAGRSADAKSIFAMLGLAAPGGAEVEVRARGPGHAECARRVASVLGAATPS